MAERSPEELRKVVFENLQAALEGGYDLEGWTPQDIAADMIAFAEDCEEEKAERLIPHIEAWRSEHNANKAS